MQYFCLNKIHDSIFTLCIRSRLFFPVDTSSQTFAFVKFTQCKSQHHQYDKCPCGHSCRCKSCHCMYTLAIENNANVCCMFDQWELSLSVQIMIMTTGPEKRKEKKFTQSKFDILFLHKLLSGFNKGLHDQCPCQFKLCL